MTKPSQRAVYTEDESHYRDGHCIVCGARPGELHSIIETVSDRPISLPGSEEKE